MATPASGLPSPLVAPRHDDTGRWLDVVRDKKVGRQRLLRIDPIRLEVRNPFGRQERVVDQELPREAPRRFAEDAVRGLRQNLGSARAAHYLLAAEQVLDRRGRDGGARPQRVDGDALRS